MVVAPATDMPMAKPAMPCSQSGVLKTRSWPYFSPRPTVHLEPRTEKRTFENPAVALAAAADVTKSKFVRLA